MLKALNVTQQSRDLVNYLEEAEKSIERLHVLNKISSMCGGPFFPLSHLIYRGSYGSRFPPVKGNVLSVNISHCVLHTSVSWTSVLVP